MSVIVSVIVTMSVSDCHCDYHGVIISVMTIVLISFCDWHSVRFRGIVSVRRSLCVCICLCVLVSVLTQRSRQEDVDVVNNVTKLLSLGDSASDFGYSR